MLFQVMMSSDILTIKTDISDVLSDQLGVNIRKITISSDNGIFDGTIEMQVHDRKDVQFIVENMKNIKDVQEVLEIL